MSDDVVIDAVKIGMLGTADVVRTVTDWLREHRPPVVVVDPVMVATSGDRLLDEDAAAAMGTLFALADLVTPNRAELAVLAELAGAPSRAPLSSLDAARLVASTWDVLVLAKGGHDEGPTSDDVLVSPSGSVRRFTAPRVATTNTHGTGCSLSSAIATLAARHGDWELAVGVAKPWLTAALQGADALQVGSRQRADRPRRAWSARRCPWSRPPTCGGTTSAPCCGRRSSAGSSWGCGTGRSMRTCSRGTSHRTCTTCGPTSGTSLGWRRALPVLRLRAFWAAASEGCAAEARDLHHRRLAGTHADDPVHPTCAGYLAHLQRAADSGSAAVLAAAVLPCFRVYAWVGAQLGTAPDGHPFADWIAAYGDAGFAASSAEATRLVEEMAAAATPAERGRMARAFRRSTEWELAFFEMPLAVPGAGAGAGVIAAEASLLR